MQAWAESGRQAGRRAGAGPWTPRPPAHPSRLDHNQAGIVVDAQHRLEKAAPAWRRKARVGWGVGAGVPTPRPPRPPTHHPTPPPTARTQGLLEDDVGHLSHQVDGGRGARGRGKVVAHCPRGGGGGEEGEPTRAGWRVWELEGRARGCRDGQGAGQQRAVSAASAASSPSPALAQPCAARLGVTGGGGARFAHGGVQIPKAARPGGPGTHAPRRWGRLCAAPPRLSSTPRVPPRGRSGAQIRVQLRPAWLHTPISGQPHPARPTMVAASADGPSPLANALGTVGGLLLSVCLVPQLVQVWRTRSAKGRADGNGGVGGAGVLGGAGGGGAAPAPAS